MNWSPFMSSNKQDCTFEKATQYLIHPDRTFNTACPWKSAQTTVAPGEREPNCLIKPL